MVRIIQSVCRGLLGLTLMGAIAIPLCAADLAHAGQKLADTGLPPLARAISERENRTVAPPQAKAFEAAPIPNLDLYVPNRTVRQQGAELAPGLFSATNTYRGEGFVPGSSPQGAQQSRRIPTPGINIKVPLN
jgi:hypothetical protein